MQVVLIYPPITTYGGENSETSAIPPLGVAYIAAFVEQEGHKVRLIDGVSEAIHQKQPMGKGTRIGLSDEQIKDEFRTFRPRLVGISSMYSAYADDAYRMARLAKEVDPDVVVVLGGAHACALPEKVLENPEVDAVVMGEGELTFAELVEKVDAGEDYLGIQGLAIRQPEGGITQTPKRPDIKDLDTLPFPARHLLPMEVYFSDHHNPYVYHNRHTFMMTSRGCPKRCIYCSIQSVWGFKWRRHSADYVAREIEHLMKEYGVREVHFVDDNLTASKKNAKRLFSHIIKRRLNIKWACPNGTAIWTLDKELMDLMKRSGCYRLTFGIESASETMQYYIKKELDVELARKNIAYANKIGIWTVSTFILGFPNQTGQQIEGSIEFAIDSNTDFATFYPLMPFPNTELWDELMEEKLVNVNDFFDNIGYYLSSRGLDTKHFSHQQIQRFAHEGHKRLLKAHVKRLFSTPVHYIRKIRSVGDVFYVFKLFTIFLGMFRHSIAGRVKTGGGVYWNKKQAKESLV